MRKKITIATRKSAMAMIQTQTVQKKLSVLYPQYEFELLPMSTKGDEILDKSLAEIGGKALFLKELEKSLLDKQADLAVHSAKDIPYELVPELCLSAYCKRDDPRDALVSETYHSLNELPQGARVGTSSLRRQSQLLRVRPDLKISPVRGNVQTRLKKMTDGNFDALILAASGLERVGLQDQIKEHLTPEVCLPAVGQGCVAIEARSDDDFIQELLAPLNDSDTQTRLTAERAMNECLKGSCQSAIAGFAEIKQDKLVMRGYVSNQDGSEVCFSELEDSIDKPQQLGTRVAEDLLAKGAAKFLS